MFLVIPVAQDHCELVIVLVVLSLGVDDERSTKAVDILAVIVGMYPICTPLTRSIDRDLIRKSLAGWNAAADTAIEMNTRQLGDKRTGPFLPLSHTCGPVIPRR